MADRACAASGVGELGVSLTVAGADCSVIVGILLRAAGGLRARSVNPGISSERINLSASFQQRFRHFDDLRLLSRLGLVPDRPDALRIGRIAHQQGSDIAAREFFGERLKDRLGVGLQAAFDPRQAGVGHAADPVADTLGECLEAQATHLAPLTDVGLAVGRPAFESGGDFLCHVRNMYQPGDFVQITL